ncbi:MAG: hypothetical protein HOO94_09490 [Novosphingobium sp.]|nr:hypothetical protein [Novosphingobium sp.]
MTGPAARPSRALFVATILTGSFLLFLVQPMVARMALPRLGGAPNVWNSAMLVYQALLLGGYAYAHALSRLPLRRQAAIHLGLFVLAALTLPIALADLPSPQPGMEALWVPALLALTIGPVFFLVSAQAPLMQRWFALHPQAGAPWALYAASNLGSFGGLIAYPLLVEPALPLRGQALGWSLGYGALLVLVALAARARWSAADGVQPAAPTQYPAPPLPARRILSWLVLAAVPSGLMLSTTTHLTTDLVAMPLLWVIPLGIYLLSFVFAFAERRGAARAMTALAWPALFVAGAMAMVAQGSSGLLPVFASVALLFLLCVALHARLYDERPDPAHLTLFYLVMSAGGALGGVFTALIAPVAFDWAWEHPLLVLLAALLLPAAPWFDWRRLPGVESFTHPVIRLAAFGLAILACIQIGSIRLSLEDDHGLALALWLGAVTVAGLVLSQWRGMALPVLLLAMLAEGGFFTVNDTLDGARQRSYFGIYTVRDRLGEKMRTLVHGTTLHGQQSLDPARRRQPLTYYGPTSGAGLAFAQAQRLFGPGARIGVVGLGAGSLACYHRPGESWQFFEIDPVVLSYSQDGTFTYLRDCAPQARVVIGDARIELGKAAPGSIDLLAIDAFSSDSIPLHLLTTEAFGVYQRALSRDGIVLVHISNRFIELEPVLAAMARARGLTAVLREDNPVMDGGLTASSWIALSRDPARIKALTAAVPDQPWRTLGPPAARVWSDDHATILPYVTWTNFLGK